MTDNTSPSAEHFESSTSRIQDIENAYPVLAKINSPKWLEIIHRAKSITASHKSTLFSDTEPCDGFLLILQGVVRVYQSATDGREMTLYRVDPGQICITSLNNLLQNQPFTATADAESDVTALLISGEDFNEMMGSSDIFRDYITSTMATRLCEIMRMTQDITFNQLNTRVASTLIHLFERIEYKELKITHQALAHELGTTREVISRILKELENQQYILLSRSKIELISLSGLKLLSNS